MTEPIRVGVIGASPDRSWAARSHLPALTALPDYEITAVATSRSGSAARAAKLLGAAHAFTDPVRLAGHPDVDLVVVAVKTPDHADLVLPALEAGKHVYCEWPFVRTTKEAEVLAQAAATAGVHHAVGLQARCAPAVRHARGLLAGGSIGRVTGVHVYAARAKGSGGTVTSDSAYTLDQRSGAGTLEVAGGHTLDLLEYLGGPVNKLSAFLSVQQPRLTFSDTAESVSVTSPDHVLISGFLATGCPVSVQIHDGKCGDARTRLEFSGTRGNLAVVSEGPASGHGIQVSDVRLYESARPPHEGWQEVPVPDRHRTPVEVPATAVRNVAESYAALARDIRTGERTVPDFEAGLRLHKLLDTVRASALTASSRVREA
ncbi:Gfo/Idh/MocA family protein [Streptomyces dysideae]|uniref:Oxidoreductase n=1 Tax=Streptomyces dysideae TaxID=909626 RepID=A0A101V4Y3_9ACTN|nr:Gfo/Idh/MocA family oxidoreductase [Streptomyces dysideae]KUO22599.1 oxidoreductase [Streptomyces dysideae]